MNKELDIPHRVIFRLGTKKFITRVFSSLEKAEEFSKTVQTLILIQPATDKVPKLNNVNEMISRFAKTNKCICNGNKLIADQYCFTCSGASFSNGK